MSATDDQALMQIAREQIGWIVEKFETSREAGQLALLSVLMAVRDDAADLSVLRLIVHESLSGAPYATDRIRGIANDAIRKAEGR